MPILYIVKLLKTSYKEKLKLINKFRGNIYDTKWDQDKNDFSF